MIKNLSKVETEGKFPNLMESIKKTPPTTTKPVGNIIIIGEEF